MVPEVVECPAATFAVAPPCCQQERQAQAPAQQLEPAQQPHPLSFAPHLEEDPSELPREAGAEGVAGNDAAV